MKKTILFVFAVVISLIAILVSCGSEKENVTSSVPDTSKAAESESTTEAPVTEAPVISKDGFSVDGYSVMRPESVSSSMKSSATNLKKSIEEFVYPDIKIVTDFLIRGTEADPSEKAILVGETNRKETEDALEILKSKIKGNGFIIKAFENKIVVCGTDETNSIKAVKYFISNFVENGNRDGYINMEKDYEFVKEEGGQSYMLNNLSELNVEFVSTVYGPTSKDTSPTITYPRILEVRYDEKNKGVLLATCEGLHKNSFGIHKSKDGGKTWEYISDVREQLKGAQLIANWQPMIYELPNAVGDMPMGTILLAGCSRDPSTAKTTRMCIWKSNDCGESWKEIAVVAEGSGGNSGLWEPFLMCDEDGSLVCFYSDETEVSDVKGQRLVYKVSKDGINWGERKYIVAPDQKNLRPGMLIITKMGNGKYFAVYEIVGLGNTIYYKTSDSLTDWDYTSIGSPVKTKDGKTFGSAPSCIWTPLGGENGTLLVTAMFMTSGSSKTGTDMFVSTDYGKTFEAIDNPLPYKAIDSHRMAYSPGFGLGEDGTVYYVNDVNSEVTKADLKLAVIRIIK